MQESIQEYHQNGPRMSFLPPLFTVPTNYSDKKYLHAKTPGKRKLPTCCAVLFLNPSIPRIQKYLTLFHVGKPPLSNRPQDREGKAREPHLERTPRPAGPFAWERKVLTRGLGREGLGKFGEKFIVLEAVLLDLCPEAVLGQVLSSELWTQAAC